MTKNTVDLARQVLSAEEYADFVWQGDIMDHLITCLRTKTPSPYFTTTDFNENLERCGAALRHHEAQWQDYAHRILAYEDRINGVTWKCAKCGKQTDRVVVNHAGWFVCSSCSE